MIKWIKISEQEPPEDKGILITDGKKIGAAIYSNEDGFINYMAYAHQGWGWQWDFDFEDVTHWSELPELPND